MIEALADLIKRNPKAADVVAAASEALAEIGASLSLPSPLVPLVHCLVIGCLVL